jgi:putative ABC transport system substrate-binding protein
MRRRAVLGGFGAAGLAGAARAQAAPPVVGFLNAAGAASEYLLVAFRAGLHEAGFVDGASVAIEARWADGDFGRLPALTRELVARRAAVIVAGGGEAAATAAHAAAGATPIVFIMGSDPVRLGLAQSFARPGGTATGVYQHTTELAAKRLAVLRDALPGARRVGMLLNPANPTTPVQREGAEAAAARAGVRLIAVEVGGRDPLEPAFAELVRAGVDALLLGGDPTYNARRATLVELAARHRIPTMYEWRESVEIGGLMSYGVSLPDMYRQAGGYVARILRGERAADLPVVQAIRFELVVNRRTTRTLGLDLPPGFVAQIDEEIE